MHTNGIIHKNCMKKSICPTAISVLREPKKWMLYDWKQLVELDSWDQDISREWTADNFKLHRVFEPCGIFLRKVVWGELLQVYNRGSCQRPGYLDSWRTLHCAPLWSHVRRPMYQTQARSGWTTAGLYDTCNNKARYEQTSDACEANIRTL